MTSIVDNTLKLVKRLKRRGALALAGNHEMRWLESKDKKIKRWHKFLRELCLFKGLDVSIPACANM
jgi:serine/threonine protein phosphatase 1